MQVSIETTQGLERKMTIAVPSERVETAVNARLQEAAGTVNLKGFRKGKVPFKVIKSRFGKSVRQDVVGEVINQSYFDALTQEKVKPAGQPNIEPGNLEEGADLTFTATFEVYPDVALPDFSALSVERLGADIGDSDIDEMVETLRQQRQTWAVVERAAADKDRVNMDYNGKLDGEEFAGGKAAGTDLILGSERMIPGFEEGLIGKKAGESFTLPLTFPAEYHSAELAGKAVEFDITVNSVSEQVLPAIDEEFFKSFGVEEGGEEAFRTEVSNNMTRELKSASRNKLKAQVMDKLIEVVDIQIPSALIAAELQQLKGQALQQMGGGANLDPSMLPDELFAEQAKRRVTLGLVLGEVMQSQNMSADPVRVRESIEELAATYESPEEVINWYYGNQEQLSAIESSVVEDQVFDYILGEAKVADKTVSYQEVIKPESNQPAEGA
ncbi:MAG: trigger factor [Gammaproteobacteria bacterium]|nr:trigger factor [Gammaproteobacteria bacterium]